MVSVRAMENSMGQTYLWGNTPNKKLAKANSKK